MPSKFRVRYIFKPLVNLLASLFNKLGMTPNLATVIMFIFSLLAFLSIIIFQNLLFFGIFIFFCGLFDGIDGAIARLSGKSSKWGGFFDSTMDRFSEFIIFFGILLSLWEEVLWGSIDMKLIIFFAYTGTILISYSRARAETIYHGDYDIGLMARSERLFYLFMISVFAYFYGYFNEFLFIYTFLVIGTYIFRAVKIRKQILKQFIKE
ncbi:MAG: CDP-alcohol phosphatidyltransferase family protein [Promethearchaeia archaeon]